jgi:hypothetical protein
MTWRADYCVLNSPIIFVCNVGSNLTSLSEIASWYPCFWYKWTRDLFVKGVNPESLMLADVTNTVLLKSIVTGYSIYCWYDRLIVNIRLIDISFVHVHQTIMYLLNSVHLVLRGNVRKSGEILDTWCYCVYLTCSKDLQLVWLYTKFNKYKSLMQVKYTQ